MVLKLFKIPSKPVIQLLDRGMNCSTKALSYISCRSSIGVLPKGLVMREDCFQLISFNTYFLVIFIEIIQNASRINNKLLINFVIQLTVWN